MGRHVFGPVPSRRLGRSLGVDLVPFKTCSYDCIYCQLGRTTCPTTERRAWVDVGEVLKEVDSYLASSAEPPDWITLSGSGEPTLHSGIGDVIDGIRGFSRIPIAVLTNGSLLWREDVRNQLSAADLVIPSLDAGDPGTFQAVNRPHEDLDFARMVAGLGAFRRAFRGRYWLEVMLVRGFTDTPEAIERIACLARDIGPDRIQINTVVRPPAESNALPVSPETLADLLPAFGPGAEVIAAHVPALDHVARTSGTRDLLDLLRRRPCSAEDIATGLGIHPAEVGKILASLLASGAVEAVPQAGRQFFRLTGKG